MVLRREPELVDREDVRGVRERDEEAAVAEGDGNRGNALQRPQRDLLERVTRRTLVFEIDVRKPMAPCERAGDAFRLRVTLVDERLGERADARTRLRSGQSIARDDLERADQIGDEIGERREACADVPVRGSLFRLGMLTECLGGPQSSRRLQGHRDPSERVIGIARPPHETAWDRRLRPTSWRGARGRRGPCTRPPRPGTTAAGDTRSSGRSRSRDS